MIAWTLLVGTSAAFALHCTVATNSEPIQAKVADSSHLGAVFSRDAYWGFDDIRDPGNKEAQGNMAPLGRVFAGTHAGAFSGFVDLIRKDFVLGSLLVKASYHQTGVHLRELFLRACVFDLGANRGKMAIRDATRCLVESDADPHPAEQHFLVRKRLVTTIVAPTRSGTQRVFKDMSALSLFLNPYQENTSLGGGVGEEALSSFARYQALSAYVAQKCETVLGNCPDQGFAEEPGPVEGFDLKGADLLISRFRSLKNTLGISSRYLVHLLQQALVKSQPACSFVDDSADNLEGASLRSNHRAVHQALRCLVGKGIPNTLEEEDRQWLATKTSKLYRSIEGFRQTREYFLGQTKALPLWTRASAFQTHYISKEDTPALNEQIPRACKKQDDNHEVFARERLRILKDYVLHQCDRVMRLCPSLEWPAAKL